MRFSWLLIPLAALTVLPRLALPSMPVKPDQARALEDIAATLQESGFTARLEDRITMDNVRAVKGECTLSAGVEMTATNNFDLFSAIQPPGRGVALLYRGAQAEAMPRVRPAVEFFAQRHLGRLGVALPVAPVVMVSADPGCGPNVPDFAHLTVLPKM